MRRLARRLDVTVPEDRWPELVQAATFDDMRTRAQLLAPDPAGIMKDRDAFFRRGTSGAGEEILSQEELARYRGAWPSSARPRSSPGSTTAAAPAASRARPPEADGVS